MHSVVEADVEATDRGQWMLHRHTAYRSAVVMVTVLYFRLTAGARVAGKADASVGGSAYLRSV
ncbi:hypothetical protein [Nocardia tengchongensis]|uniref:hypothetical protein n=1 Tax=Nocardia tengchongensis TaxID=2055889 RepID=UPI0036961492